MGDEPTRLRISPTPRIWPARSVLRTDRRDARRTGPHDYRARGGLGACRRRQELQGAPVTRPHPKTSEDHDLVRRARAGDHRAVASLVARNVAFVYRLVSRHTSLRHPREDLIHEGVVGILVA